MHTHMYIHTCIGNLDSRNRYTLTLIFCKCMCLAETQESYGPAEKNCGFRGEFGLVRFTVLSEAVKISKRLNLVL